MRNTYTLLDFGNFVDDSSNDRDSPYVQLLPITNMADAHADFVKVRLNGQDTTGDSSKALLPADQMQHSPESAKEKKQHYEEKVLSRWPYILAGCLVFLTLCIGLCVWRCCCRRGKKVKKSKGGILATPSSYIPIHQNHSNVHMLPGGGQHAQGGHHTTGGHHDGGFSGGNY